MVSRGRRALHAVDPTGVTSSAPQTPPHARARPLRGRRRQMVAWLAGAPWSNRAPGAPPCPLPHRAHAKHLRLQEVAPRNWPLAHAAPTGLTSLLAWPGTPGEDGHVHWRGGGRGQN